MNSYQIITDSACDFPAGKYEELGLKAVPLSVEFRGAVSDDRNDSSLKDFYRGLREGEIARTSAVNPQRWKEAMVPSLELGQDVLVMSFSSGLSTTCQSAQIAAAELREEYPLRKILVVDTLCASMGQGLLVYHACRMQGEGASVTSVYNWVQDHKLNLCHWFTVDDLYFLKRGGRISGATAVLGTMLNIKPVLHVDDEGHLVSVSKARGRKAAIEAMAKKVEELGRDFDNSVMYISHGDCLEDAEALARILRERYGVKEVLISYVGAVIGSHSGPGTLALFFLGRHR